MALAAAVKVRGYYIRQNLPSISRQNIDTALPLLHEMRAPDRFDLSDIHRFLRNDDMGPEMMDGVDAKTWGCLFDPDSHPRDLIGVHPRKRGDKFSNFVSEKAIRLSNIG